MQETQVWSLSQEEPLEKGMATHSNILAWRILWTESILHGVEELDMTEQLTKYFNERTFQLILSPIEIYYNFIL